MRLARWVFLLAGVSGLVMIVPPYFLERQTGEDYPPPITHPEYYYGFLGVTLAWQVLFLVIGSDPIRYRRAMLPALVEKAGFVLAIAVLYLRERVAAMWLGFAAMDAAWLVLFLVAFLLTPKDSARAGEQTRR